MLHIPTGLKLKSLLTKSHWLFPDSTEMGRRSVPRKFVLSLMKDHQTLLPSRFHHMLLTDQIFSPVFALSFCLVACLPIADYKTFRPPLCRPVSLSTEVTD